MIFLWITLALSVGIIIGLVIGSWRAATNLPAIMSRMNAEQLRALANRSRQLREGA